ncbi:MAG: hypothetical protein ACP5TL_00755 [Candidatus Micrarchaeia archaeon]
MVVLLILSYGYFGPEWDLMAHYINARSFANPAFYACLFNKGCVLATQNSAFYFEYFRAPLSSTFLLIFELVANKLAIPLYIGFVFMLFIISVYILAKEMKLDMLISISVFVAPFMILFTLLSNSTEMLSLSFALLGTALLTRKSPWSGLFFGLASLSKYVMLISLPMVLLLYKPKKIAIAIALFILPIIPWLIFNQLVFGNYLFSYLESLHIVSSSIFTHGINLGSLLFVCANSIIFGTVAIIYILKKRIKISGFSKKFHGYIKDQNAKISVVFLLLSIVSYVFIAYNRDTFTQIRFGYLLHGALALFMVLLLSNISRVKKYTTMPFFIGIASIIIILANIFTIASIYNYGPSLSIWNPVFGNAVKELSILGYGNCNVVSNDWIYLLYLNAHAFSPFYVDKIENEYPIVVFYNSTAATSPSSIADLNTSKVIFNNKNFSILLPRNYTCINTTHSAAAK